MEPPENNQTPTPPKDLPKLGTVLSVLESRWSGDEFDAEMAERRARYEAGKKPAEVKDAVQRLVARVGARYAACTVRNFIPADDAQKRSVEALVAYMHDLRKNIESGASLIFYGPCGVGKDHLMAAAMFHAARSGFEVHWENGLDWFGRVRDDLARTEKHIETLVRPTVLAISDPVPPATKSGKADGDLTAWRIELLQRVVDARYRQLRPVWMTINATGIEGLRNLLSVPLADRLLHGAVGVQLVGKSVREQAT